MWLLILLAATTFLSDDQTLDNEIASAAQLVGDIASVKSHLTMKTLFALLFTVWSQSDARPQNSVNSFSTFSNFDPRTQTFSAGSNTQLTQTFSGQDSFSTSGLFSQGSSGFDILDGNDFLDPNLPFGGRRDIFSDANGKQRLQKFIAK